MDAEVKLDALPQGSEVHTIYKSVKNKKWTKAKIDDNLVQVIKNKSNLPHIIAELLAKKNLAIEEVQAFLNPTLKDSLPDPNILMDMNKAVDLTIAYIKERKKITIFGDYDVDGATSSSLLKRMFNFLKHDDVDIYIPDRTLEGYGINAPAMSVIRQSGTELLISVDCGSTSHEAIDVANELGMRVIVIDHHLCSTNLPDAIVINPNRPDDSSELGYLAAVGVSYLFMVALTRAMVRSDLIQVHEVPDLLSFLDLVALGTVCDVAQLIGLNRVFVRQGLKVLEARKNLGIKALIETSKIQMDNTELSTYHLGFILGPKINAGGRVGQSNLGSKLLSSEDVQTCSDIAMRLEMYNHERKIVESKTLNEALAEAAFIPKDTPMVCLSGEAWHQGVIGIVAERLKEKFGKPAMVISFDDAGIGKASCRSINGIDIGAVVIEAKEQGLLIVGGGHKMAAGFTIRKERLDDFKIFLKDKLNEPYKKAIANSVSHYDSLLSIESITTDLARQINCLGPFGHGNDQPKFMLNSVSIVQASLIRGEHVSCVLKDFSNNNSSKTIRSICFRGTQSALGEILLSKRPNLNLIVTLSLNRWQNQERTEVMILDAVLP